MTEALPDVVREKMKALKVKYVQSLAERVRALDTALSAIKEGSGFDREMYFSAQNNAHKFVGSGQTFGFLGISNTARELEVLIEVWLQKERKPSEEELEKAYALLSALSQYCKEAQEGLGFVKMEAEAWKQGRGMTGFETVRAAGERQVLIWESHNPVVEDLQEQIGFFGFPLEVVSSVKDLEQWVEQKKAIVLIIPIDGLMQRMELLEEIRSFKHNNQPNKLKLLYVSEKEDFQTRLLAVRHGGDGFICSPFDIPKLIEKIDGLFQETEKAPYHVMIVDDDPEQISYYAMVLQQAGMLTSVVTDPKNVMKVLVEEKPELILMDMYMPGCKGEELGALIRQQEAFVGIPIVYFSVEKDRDKQVTALIEGKGDDFIIKPIKPEHLVALITTRAERIRQLRFFMERDSLTGLLNHSQLYLRLVSELDRARRLGTQVVYGMIDLDHFKKINDEHGHLMGDHVIKTISRLFVERLRKTDSVGRYGGEEFGIILINTNLENGVRVFNELRESFSRIRHHGEGKDFYATFSCGVADYPRFSTPDALIEAADKALYEAKRQGRNRVIPAS